MTQGFFVNSADCYGCKSCQVACANEKLLTPGVFIRRVRQINAAAPGGHAFVSMACNHCDEPACVANCPTGAMAKREDNGAVVVDQDVCIGCGTCVNSCPYEVPQIDEEAGVSSKCTLCFDRLDNDHRPWCVQACPAEARIVGDLNDPESEVSKYIAEKGAVPYLEENGTTPSVYYV